MENRICKTCLLNLSNNDYRTIHNKECKKCQNIKYLYKKNIRNKKFYENNKQNLQEHNLLNYYKKIYDNKNLSLHEVKLLKIKI